MKRKRQTAAQAVAAWELAVSKATSSWHSPGVICPACVSPKMQRKEPGVADPACMCCRGDGIVDVAWEIAWLKANKGGCYREHVD